jgi:hypothetical protein
MKDLIGKIKKFFKVVLMLDFESCGNEYELEHELMELRKKMEAKR